MESLVHVEDLDDLGSIEWRATAITIPGAALECPLRFPRTRRTYPYSPSTQGFGSEWAGSQRSVALRVPSAVVPGEFNFIVNPAHPGFDRLKVAATESFALDPRLAR
jgi:RES domain-containing protein